MYVIFFGYRSFALCASVIYITSVNVARGNWGRALILASCKKVKISAFCLNCAYFPHLFISTYFGLD